MPVDPAITKRFIESLSTHLEDHLASWKSQLVDARREVDSLLSGMSEKIPAQAKPLFPEDIVELMLEDAIPPAPPPQKVVEKVVERVVEQVPGPPDWSSVRSAMASIEAARTQVDVLTRFLVQSQSHASRVCLLVLRNDRLTGWKAIGFDATGGRDDAARALDLAGDDDAFLAEALRRERPVLAERSPEGGKLRQTLGGRPAARTLLVPMVIRDRVAGLLVADELPDGGHLNVAALECLTFVTGLAVDLLAARKKIPSPSLTPSGEDVLGYEAHAPAPAPSPSQFPDIGATTRLSAVPQPAPADFAAPKPKITDAGQALRALEESAAHRRALPVPTPRPAAGARAVVPDLGLAAAPPRPAAPPARPAPPPPAPPAPAPPAPAPAAAQPPSSGGAGGGDLTLAFESLKAAGAVPPAPPVRPPAPPPPPPPPPAAAPAPPPAPPAAGVGAGGLDLVGGAQPVAAPAGFVPRAMRARAMDDQQRAQEDAKRLARLLVSEIKLYNEKKVDEGRLHRDLYSRLKDDIDRSRQVYEERTPEAVRKGTTFFHDELVRILCDGRAEVLGPMG